MSEHLINTWHCDNDDCNKIFYTDLESLPSCCPYCYYDMISDSKVLVAQPLVFNKEKE
jgi:hypothetical protein